MNHTNKFQLQILYSNNNYINLIYKYFFCMSSQHHRGTTCKIMKNVFSWRSPKGQQTFHKRGARKKLKQKMLSLKFYVLAIAPWFRLPSCGPRFESLAHHLCFFSLYCDCNEKRTKINKKRPWLAHRKNLHEVLINFCPIFK